MSYSSGPYGYQNPNSQDAQLIQWFQAVDQDRSGKISSAELRQALVVGNGTSFSVEACDLLVKMFSQGNSKTIDFQGFQHLFQYINQWKVAFQSYDKDNSGTIDRREFGQTLFQMGYRLSEQTMEALINRYASMQGQITMDSFIIVSVKLHQLTNAFRRFDTQNTGIVTMGYEDFLRTVIESA